MAAKKKSPFSIAGYVRQHPNVMPKELVAMAAKQGHRLTVDQVYQARKVLKKRGAVRKAGGAQIGNGRRKSPIELLTEAEFDLVIAMKKVGLERAKKLFDFLEALQNL